LKLFALLPLLFGLFLSLLGCGNEQSPTKEEAAKTASEETKSKEDENMDLGVGHTAEIGGLYITLDRATLVTRDPNVLASPKDVGKGAKGKVNPPEGKMTENETFVALDLTVSNTSQQTVPINAAINFRLTDPNGYTFSRQSSNLLF